MTNLWYAHGLVRENSKVTIICFPYAGGTASNYSRFKKYLSEDFSIYPVLYPLREKRFNQPMPDTVEQLAKDFVDANEDLFRKPFILVGHCTGCIIAYETAKYVESKMQKVPLHFVASGSKTPDRLIIPGDLECLSDENFIKMLIETHRISAEAEKVPNFKEYYLPIMRADFLMFGRYSYDKTDKLNCPLTTLYATEDKQVSPEHVAEWEKFAGLSYETYSFDGGHYFMENNTEEICNILNKLI